MNRKTIIIIAVILFAIAGLFLAYLKLRPMVAFKIAAVKALKKYSKEIVQNCERIFRMETAHFTSSQFKHTYSPGMEKFASTFPYGWTTLNKVLWKDFPIYAPVGTYTMPENQTGITKTFLKFPTLTASVMTVCAFLDNNGNNPAAWYSKNLESQARYQKTLNGIIPKITNEVA